MIYENPFRVGKKKLQRFAEMQEFNNVVQAGAGEVLSRQHSLYGKWAAEFFGNRGPVILELGCGKGEYTVELARMFPERNFVGIDIKGARMWKGARHALYNNLDNAGFLRTRIEMISSFFARNEVDGIWITFPDPQPRKSRKRLTAPAFLNRYREFLRQKGNVHLKTDSRELYEYTLSVLEHNRLKVIEKTSDLYGSGATCPVLSIRTYYEKQFLEQGKPICYIKFRIDGNEVITEPDEE